MAVVQFFRQLFLLCWKNLLVQLRAPVWTFFEIVPPILLVIAFVCFRGAFFSGETVEHSTSCYERLECTSEIWTLARFKNKTLRAFSYPEEEESRRAKIFHNTVFKMFLGYHATCFTGDNAPKLLLYTPITAATNRLMQQIKNLTDLQIKGFSSEQELENYAMNRLRMMNLTAPAKCPSEPSAVYAGIVFSFENFKKKGAYDYSIRLPNIWTSHKEYVSRSGNYYDNKDNKVCVCQKQGMGAGGFGYQTSSVFPKDKWLHQKPRMLRVGDDGGEMNAAAYHASGFVPLQHAINTAIINELTGQSGTTSRTQADVPVSSMEYQYLPHPPYRGGYIADTFMTMTRVFGVVFIVLGMVTTALYSAKAILSEIESQMKDYMVTMGLSNSCWWLSHFIFAFVKQMVIMFVCACMLCYVTVKSVHLVPPNYSTLPNTDLGLLFLFLMLWAVNIILMSYTTVCIFTKGWRVTTFVLIFWVLSLVPGFLVDTDSSSVTELCLACLMLNAALAVGTEVLLNLEMCGNALSYSTLSVGVTPNSAFSMLHVLCMMCVQTVLYLSVIMFCDERSSVRNLIRIILHKMGSRKSKRTGAYDMVPDCEDDSAKRSRVESGHGIEQQPSISINNLKKTFRTGALGRGTFTAVDRLSFDVLPNQLTVLLGHNGAGKSTTFSMLTGSLTPTSGSATIIGFDVYSQFEQIRRKMGFCPQHNVLFPTLSVQKHLEFFCKLKGAYVDDVEIEELLDLLSLREKKNAKSNTLSGGQKRKLSVGIALVGHSEIVLLDEPSSGVDAQTRHEFWKLLLQEKTKRTILMTTHYMEEADVLGDRIVIMTHGKLHTAGTSMFLKRKYGAGYHVSMTYGPQSTALDVQNTLTLLQTQAGTEHKVLIEAHNKQQATFLLPYQARSRFAALFTELDANQSRLQIVSFGVGVSTLEDVFIKVGEEAKAKEAAKKGEAVVEHKFTTEDLSCDERLQGMRLCWARVKALMLKRMYCWLQGGYSASVMMLVYLVLLSILLALTFMSDVARDVAVAHEDQSLPFRMQMFPKAQVHLFAPNHLSKEQQLLYNSVSQSLDGQLGEKVTLEHDYESSQPVNEYYRQHESGPFDLLHTLNKRVLALQFTRDHNIRLWVNGEAYHALPLAVSLVDNARLKLMTSADYSITTSLHPFPAIDGRTKTTVEKGSMEIVFRGYVMPLIALCFIVLVLADYTARFTLVIAEEKQSGMKHLQYASGLSPFMYWAVHFLWDYLTLLLPAYMIMILFGIFGFTGFFYGTAPLAYCLLFLTFGAAQIPSRYLITYVVNAPTRTMMLSTTISLLTGIIWLVVSYVPHMLSMLAVLDGMEGHSTSTMAIVEYCIRLFGCIMSPMFNMAFGLINVFIVGSISEGCAMSTDPVKMQYIEEHAQQMAYQQRGSEICFQTTSTVLDEASALRTYSGGFGFRDNAHIRSVMLDGNLLLGFHKYMYHAGVGLHIACMAIQTVVYWLIIFAIDYRRCCCCCARSKHVQEEGSLNSDVAVEESRVQAIEPDQQMLIARGLRQQYRDTLAVRRVTFGVSIGECFGLLGVNGAGKTTTFKMLTGELPITQGEVYINALSVNKNWTKACTVAGYCPQFEAVLQQLTGEQLVRLFGRLRGIPDNQLSLITQNVLEAVDITRYKDRPFHKYSGGTKRRCSLGVALIGVPSVLMLDEPTTGVDPVARRALWDILKELKDSATHKVAILLTSHSMEECDALCDRLAIMIQGQFSCLGSPQYLKSNFGTSFTLNIRLSTEQEFEAADKAILLRLPGASCTQHHNTHVQYNVPVSATAALTDQTLSRIWPKLFELMEQLSHELKLEDYSLSQSTLEDVFLAFSSKSQMPAMDALQNEYARQYAEWEKQNQASWRMEDKQPAADAPITGMAQPVHTQ